MTRAEMINELEYMNIQLLKDEDPDCYDLDSAVQFWRTLPTEELLSEYNDTLNSFKSYTGV